MITSIQIESYKCFDSLRLDLRPLTMLTGYNGAGKSSAIQPLLLLAQAARLRSEHAFEPGSELPLNGEVVRLGTSGEVLHAGSRRMRFVLEADEQVWQLTFGAKPGGRSLIVEDNPVPNCSAVLAAHLGRLVYVSAVREGAADSFPMSDQLLNSTADVGVDGRFASYWYHELADTEIDEARRYPRNAAITFRKQVDAWLGDLAPGAEANVQAISVASALVLQFRLSPTGEWRRPANIGYGLTYAFPIIVALLAAARGDIVVIDSPEAHLHPRAQSRMGWMLAHFAAVGVRVVVETHSDHVLNGARLAVRDQAIRAEDVGLLFFSGFSDEGHGVTRPRMDSEGRINEWPEGFFDQSEKDVALLAGWS